MLLLWGKMQNVGEMRAERVRAVAFLLARINLKMYTKGSV